MSRGILVNKDFMSKLAIITLFVLKGKFTNSLTKENVSVIVKGLVEKGRRGGTKNSATYNNEFLWKRLLV